MTKSYAILEKKLDELQACLLDFFTLPAADTPSRQNLTNDIETRFLFLRNLLRAEFAAVPMIPQSPAHLDHNRYQDQHHNHLGHIVRRVSHLEAAYRNCDDESEVVLAAHDRVDGASTCSCTESRLSDDEDGDSDDELWGRQTSFVEESEVSVGAEAEAERDSGGKEKRWKWRDLGVLMGSGMIVGAALMGWAMVGFCDNFIYYQVLYDSDHVPVPT